jgi:PilZ domain
MSSPPERRKSRRYPCYGPFNFRIDGWYITTGNIVDLCLNGCLLQPRLQSEVNINDILDLRFEVNRLNFRARCIVRRISPDGTLGIEILFLSDRLRNQFQELIEELKSPEQASS